MEIKLLKNLKWLKDIEGDYWVADLYVDGKKLGVTGNYYDLPRSPKDEELEWIKTEYQIEENNNGNDTR